MSLVHGKNDLWDDLPLRKVTIRDMSYIVRTLYIGPPWKRMTWIAHQVKFNDSIVHEPGDPNLYPTLDRPLFTKKSWVSIGQCFKEHEVIDAVHDSSAIPGVVRLQCWDRTDNRTTQCDVASHHRVKFPLVISRLSGCSSVLQFLIMIYDAMEGLSSNSQVAADRLIVF